MSTSGIEPAYRKILYHAAVNLGIAAFCAVFGAVYEHFSFGVYSNYMIYAFAAPMLAGILLILSMICQRLPQARTLLLLYLTAATLTVGSITAGILKISGRDSGLLAGYWAAGGILALLTVYAYFKELRCKTDT